MSDILRVVLVGGAKSAHDQMLRAARADKTVTINSSKLINWIVSDYFERFFEKRRNDLCKAHFNPRKRIREAMRDGDLVEMKRALEEVTRNLEANKKTADRPKTRDASGNGGSESE